MTGRGCCFFLSLGLFFLIAGSSCSTPQAQSTGRHGFFDSIDLDTKASGRRSSGLMKDSSRVLGEFRWPVRYVQVTSLYGRRGKSFHEGVDLRAPLGTSVYASKAGVVLYADSKIRGYGNLVVIRHSGKLATIYAHNSKLLVQRGQRVKQGQLIAVSGNTGHSSGPHVHFEVRRGTSAVNPLKVLPQFGPTLARPEIRNRRLATSVKSVRGASRHD